MPTPESAAFLAKKPTVPPTYEGVDFEDNIAVHNARDAIIREQWVRSMMARLVGEELGKCYAREGVNHFEKCGKLRGLSSIPFSCIKKGTDWMLNWICEFREIFRITQGPQDQGLSVRGEELFQQDGIDTTDPTKKEYHVWSFEGKRNAYTSSVLPAEMNTCLCIDLTSFDDQPTNRITTTKSSAVMLTWLLLRRMG